MAKVLVLYYSSYGHIEKMAEAVAGGHHYRILFMLGALLFAVTFISNMIGDVVMHRLKHKLEGKR